MTTPGYKKYLSRTVSKNSEALYSKVRGVEWEAWNPFNSVLGSFAHATEEVATVKGLETGTIRFTIPSGSSAPVFWAQLFGKVMANGASAVGDAGKYGQLRVHNFTSGGILDLQNSYNESPLFINEDLSSGKWSPVRITALGLVVTYEGQTQTAQGSLCIRVGSPPDSFNTITETNATGEVENYIAALRRDSDTIIIPVNDLLRNNNRKFISLPYNKTACSMFAPSCTDSDYLESGPQSVIQGPYWQPITVCGSGLAADGSASFSLRYVMKYEAIPDSMDFLRHFRTKGIVNTLAAGKQEHGIIENLSDAVQGFGGAIKKAENALENTAENAVGMMAAAKISKMNPVYYIRNGSRFIKADIGAAAEVATEMATLAAVGRRLRTKRAAPMRKAAPAKKRTTVRTVVETQPRRTYTRRRA